MRCDVLNEITHRDPFNRIDLRRIRFHDRIASPDEHMIELVLDQCPDFGAIEKAEHEFERTIESELLSQPPMRRIQRFFVGSGMAAAGVRPQATRMIFVERATLNQHALARRVEDEDGDRAMEHAAHVGELFLHDARGAVVLVDQDYVAQETLWWEGNEQSN